MTERRDLSVEPPQWREEPAAVRARGSGREDVERGHVPSEDEGRTSDGRTIDIDLIRSHRVELGEGVKVKIGNIAAIARRRGVPALLGAVWWGGRGLVTHKVLGRRFIERRVHGRPMILDLTDRGISRTLLLFGTREAEHVQVLREVLQPGMTVLDIGANIGYYALLELDLVGSSGTVLLVEPSPENVDLLRRNLARNGHGDVPVLEVAVSDTSGTRAFHLSSMSNMNTFHDVGTGTEYLTGTAIDVTTVTVPDLVPNGRLDLIRMDVEGHEVEVLAGMLDAIDSGTLAPMILFETHLTRYSKEHDIERVLRRLFAAGYRAHTVGSSSERGSAIIEARGYRGGPPIRTDDVHRILYTDIAEDDLVDMVARTGGIRTVLLAPSP